MAEPWTEERAALLGVMRAAERWRQAEWCVREATAAGHTITSAWEIHLDRQAAVDALLAALDAPRVRALTEHQPYCPADEPIDECPCRHTGAAIARLEADRAALLAVVREAEAWWMAMARMYAYDASLAGQEPELSGRVVAAFRAALADPRVRALLGEAWPAPGEEG